MDMFTNVCIFEPLDANTFEANITLISLMFNYAQLQILVNQYESANFISLSCCHLTLAAFVYIGKKISEFIVKLFPNKTEF